ncbi:MAG: class I fructose-bisphosphate aldolase [Thermoleophilaceae bacterium]
MTTYEELEGTARALVAPGKGILAADESTGTMAKRLRTVGVESELGARNAFRELLVAAPDAGDAISGMILYDETFRSRTHAGVPFPEAVVQAGIIPGIKVDTGAKPLAGTRGEKVTEGLDGLRERLGEYRMLGARFAKWRAVIAIGTNLPSSRCVTANAHALARYAALCQEQGLVPIVEPEVLMDGHHTLERCERVTEELLLRVYAELDEQQVRVEATLLKPNMVLPGAGRPEPAGPDEVAESTVRCLRRSVPAEVPGIVFLSGGQDDRVATERLDAINRLGPQPWELSFSFGRALQASALAAWRGKPANREAAEGAFIHRARCTAAARRGEYSPALERKAVVA